MTPRKSPKEPLEDVLAASVRRLRDEHNWTQEQLAEQMRKAGFKSWARTTVTEVEGSGRRRQISVAELFGLAHVFGSGVGDILAARRLELTASGLTLDTEGFYDLLFGPGLMEHITNRVTSDTLVKIVQTQVNRIYGVMAERTSEVAKELRDTADWFETTAMERLMATPEKKEGS